MNAGPNKTKFDLLFNNCADFARVVLNDYFPRTFRRSIFPDAFMTTPKQITYKLVRFARKNPGTELTVFEIPQIPGYRARSHSAKGIDESFITTIYAIPIALLNPYVAGGLFVDYLVRGRYHLIPKDPTILGPDNLSALTMARLTASSDPREFVHRRYTGTARRRRRAIYRVGRKGRGRGSQSRPAGNGRSK